jgi:PAS domain S-box-containing protein
MMNRSSLAERIRRFPTLSLRAANAYLARVVAARTRVEAPEDAMEMDPLLITTTAEFRVPTRDMSDETRMRGLEAALRRREAVLEAVSYAASRFLGTLDWDHDVREMLGRLGGAAEVARVHLFEAYRDGEGALHRRLRYEWAAEGATVPELDPALRDVAVSEIGARWTLIERGEVLHGPVVSLAPGERAYFARLGIGSFAAVPVFAGDCFWGYIGLADSAIAREWSASVLDALKVAAATIGAAIYRKQAEERLQQSEERYRRLTEAAVEGVLIHVDGVIVEVNPAFERMLGYTRDELAGRPVLDVIGTAESREVIERHMRVRSTASYEVRGQRKDGTSITAEVTARNTYFRGRPARVVTVHDVTERRRTEAELVRRESQLAHAQAIAHMGSWDWIVETNDLTGSDEMYRIYGFDPADPPTTGQILGCIHPDDAPMVRSAIDGAIIDGRDFNVEHRIVRPLGEVRLVHEQGRALRDASGATVTLVGAGHDITESRAAEESLSRHRAQLAEAQAIAHVGSFVWDFTTDTLRGSDELYRIYGVDTSIGPAELLERVHPDDAALVRQTIEDATQHGSSFAIEHRIVHPDGTVRRFRVEGRVILDEHGTPTQMIGAGQDVTERREAEEVARRLIEERAAREAAEAAERRAAFLAEGSRVLGSSFDYQTTLASLTRLAVPTLADYCTVDVIGRDGAFERVGVAHVVPEKERILWDITRYVKDGAPMVGHLKCALFTGESTLVPEVTAADVASYAVDEEHGRMLLALAPRSLVCVPLQVSGRVLGAMVLYASESGRHYGPDDLAVATELARRAALAVENARLFSEAEQATRSRDQMLGVVAHDLRNPLGTILMASELIEDALPPNAPAHRHVGMVLRAGERMNRLIQDLLDVKRMENGRLAVEPRPVPANAIIAEALEMLRPLAAASGIDLVPDAPDGLPEVSADPQRVQQVLSNLIGNAIKFTPRGGRVTLGGCHADGELRLSIADTGPGIPAEQLPHIFSQFWQGSRTDRRGIGLGLAIARGIVDAHGGRIWVESTVGAGSRFLFTLPVHVGTSPSAAQAVLPVSPRVAPVLRG